MATGDQLRELTSSELGRRRRCDPSGRVVL